VSKAPDAQPELPEVRRLAEVMTVLRQRCPWDAQQTHRSLVQYLVEETCEVTEAIEAGHDDDLIEELGDLLLQVVFHAEIARQERRFDLDDVAGRVVDKLISRHPHVFGDEVLGEDLYGIWERRKAAEKGRRSALDGIPDQLSAITRASKVFTRAKAHGLNLQVPQGATDEASQLGQELLALVARAHAQGVDAEQALRDAVRGLERQVSEAGTGPRTPAHP
jgi:XTP/dITP diphosphohydrolase